MIAVTTCPRVTPCNTRRSRWLPPRTCKSVCAATPMKPQLRPARLPKYLSLLASSYSRMPLPVDVPSVSSFQIVDVLSSRKGRRRMNIVRSNTPL
ncbi:unnamed protein product [Macrosiphum euphorbiae]|uniref:Uncharacterized protein n=1 Tax=Macrosiphum euphorbiae TaxID=13131 RepID=A0AAV0WTW9_9HEMI|nr:unnamed protein product [Macrosiphum euphorbiae]